MYYTTQHHDIIKKKGGCWEPEKTYVPDQVTPYLKETIVVILYAALHYISLIIGMTEDSKCPRNSCCESKLE